MAIFDYAHPDDAGQTADTDDLIRWLADLADQRGRLRERRQALVWSEAESWRVHVSGRRLTAELGVIEEEVQAIQDRLFDQLASAVSGQANAERVAEQLRTMLPTEGDAPSPRKDMRRAEVWAMTGGRCWYCGTQTNPFATFHVEHVTPRSRGGADALPNLVPSCRDCNLSKGAMDLDEWREKWGGGVFWGESRPDLWEPGRTVQHVSFGNGTVVEVSEESPTTILTVEFEDGQRRTVMARAEYILGGN